MELISQCIRIESLWGKRDPIVKRCYELVERLAPTQINNPVLVIPASRSSLPRWTSPDLTTVHHEHIHDTRDLVITPPMPYIISDVRAMSDYGKIRKRTRMLTLNELISWCRAYHDLEDEVYLSSSKIFSDFAGIIYFGKVPAITTRKTLHDGIALLCDTEIII